MSYQIGGAFAPDEVTALAFDAILRIKAGDFGDDLDKLDPYKGARRIQRLRVSFAKATI